MQIFFARLATALLILIGAMCILLAVLAIVSKGPGGARGIRIGPLIAMSIGGAMIYGAIRLNRRAKRLDGALPSADNRVGEYLANQPESRWLGEKEYEVHYQPPVRGRGGRPSSLVIRLPAMSPTTLKFNDEKRFDRLGKRLGIAVEHQTGDADFDNEVYVRGTSPEYAALLLKDDDARLAVRALLRHGMNEVRYTGTHVEAAWPGFNPVKDDRPELAEHTAAGLVVLAEKIPDSGGLDAFSDHDEHYLRHAALWILQILFAATIVSAFVFPPIYLSELFLAGMTAFAAVYPLYGFVAAVALRGTSISHDRWGRLLLVGLLLLSLGSCGSVAAINGLLDHSPPQTHSLIISDKREVRGSRGSRSYRVDVPAWDQPGTISFSVSRREFSNIMPGRSRLELITHEGSLRIEWLEDKRVQR